MYKNEEIQKFFIFIYFLFMQGHPCRTKLKRNEFLLLKFMIFFFFLLFFIIHWLWNSWFPFSSCFSSSYIDFEIHDFLFLPAYLHHTLTLKGFKFKNALTFLIIQCSKSVARRQNSKVLAIPKCGFFQKYRRYEEFCSDLYNLQYYWQRKIGRLEFGNARNKILF